MMKSFWLIHIITALPLFVGCRQNGIENARPFSFEDFGEPIPLQGKLLPTGTIWNPSRIYCMDTSLLLIDMSRNCFIQTYHIRNFQKTSENMPSGIGPSESLSCWNLHIGRNTVNAFDMQAQKIKIYEKNKLASHSHINPSQTITLMDATTEQILLPDSTVVSSCLADISNLLSKYDSNGIRGEVSASYPKIVHGNYSDEFKKRLFENRLFYSESNDKIVVTYVYTDLIDIYDNELNLLTRIHGPDMFVPSLGKTGNYIHTVANKTKFAYLSSYLTKDEIWTLYYGILPNAPGDDHQNRILVFDFNGKPLRMYVLSHPIYSFCINETNSTLYGLTSNPEPCIFQFPFQ